MAIQINGNGTITGISSGGLPAGSVTSATLADGAASGTKLTMPAGSILQVKHKVMDTDLDLGSPTDWTNITNLVETITPSNTNNKIIIQAWVHVTDRSSTSGDDLMVALALKKNGTLLSYNADSNRAYGDFTQYISGQSREAHLTSQIGSFCREDVGGSTSALSYQVVIKSGSIAWSGNATGINKVLRTDDAWYVCRRARSTITLMEVKA